MLNFYHRLGVVSKHGACGYRGRRVLALFSGLDFFLFLIAGFLGLRSWKRLWKRLKCSRWFISNLPPRHPSERYPNNYDTPYEPDWPQRIDNYDG